MGFTITGQSEETLQVTPNLTADASSTVRDLSMWFQNYYQADQKTKEREKRNWKYFSGVNCGQWPERILKLLSDEGRAPHQFNIIKQKVQLLAGQLIMNGMETKYENSLGTANDQAVLLNHIYLTAKNLGSWETDKVEMIRDGLIFRGTLELYVNYDQDPLGTIGLRRLNPFNLIFDPNWTTDNINDNDLIFQTSKLTARQIKNMFGKNNDDVKLAISRQQQYRASQNWTELDKICDTNPLFWDQQNDRYTVIQCYELEQTTVERLLNTNNGEYYPDTLDQTLVEMIKREQGQALKVVPEMRTVCKITTIIPGLSRDTIFSEGLHPVQVGRYPLYTFSAYNLNGEVSGIVDDLIDVQEVLNKRESTITHLLTTAAMGATLVEEDAMSDSEFERYKKHKNKPGEIYRVKPGSNNLNKVRNLTDTTIPPTLLQERNWAVEMSDRLSPAVPAVAGQQEYSGQSGKLYDSLREQGLVTIEMLNRQIKKVEHQLGESMYYLIKQIYSGPERQIKNSKTGELITLNQDIDGAIVNNVAEIKRPQVVVAVSNESTSVRRQQLDLYISLLQYMPDDESRILIELNIVDAMPNIQDEVKSQMKTVLLDKLAFLQKQRKSQEAQMDAQVAQATQPPVVPGQAPVEAPAPQEAPQIPQ